MNHKEVGELRRRMRRDRSNMTTIYGCYVSSQKEIICEFSESVGLLSENEAEKYFGLLKRSLSGTIGKNLIDICFQTSQVAGSSEHKLLMDLRMTALKDADLRQELYKKIMEGVHISDNYLILLGCDSYDVPFKSKDDTVQADASDENFTYILCAVCPVKLAKATLKYDAENKQFHDSGAANVAGFPEVGFLFPAFDNRSTNIYNALLYTRSPKEDCSELADSLFHARIPQPAYEQKKSFEALLSTSLENNCDLQVMQNVHEQICQCIELHKESRVAEPLLISKEQIKDVLEDSGVPEKNVAKFSVDFDSTFGFETELHPGNIIDKKHFDIVTPDVTIKVNPERRDLIETRIIGGVKYILIRAEESVEVNGVQISISEKEAFSI